jgi:chlorobactene glucosyltransferase
MIPARNEERNIANCLDSLLMQDYTNFEILVLDDNSEDSTWNIISDYAAKHPNIKVIKGGSLLPGWTGKNNALRQLVAEAKGEIYLFTDADNSYAQNAVSNSIKYIEKFDLDYLSAFPQQITKSFSEKLIIPFIDIVIYSFFILWSQYFIKWNIFATANGQWIVCKKKSYNALGGHTAVKGRIVEDVSLFREAKRRNMKTLTLAGTSVVYGRMYSSFSEIWHGLSKNIFGITDYNIPLFILINLILFVFIIMPYFLILFTDTFFVILSIFTILILWRLLLAIFFKHNIGIAVVLHPFLILIINILSINALLRYKYGSVSWKGRKMTVKDKEVSDTYE